ncbi:glycosyltransferase [Bifidobacterium eulemuris]|uniref:Glycosyltransferase n=1 Tax=Bifidobacterium eulemuris TaxID=1765219 RepID=A0A261FYY7_9BIFI|nr:glycosyltransferase [Bifidobacterium eulemuris]OZG64357.1 glycosyltransferase [Bifidobacterium eulemuris]QOL32443.1 glycosyltransferase [Bifidobacterium eulemuris]
MTDIKHNVPTVMAFGTYNVRKHPRVGILIDGLRRNGCRVEEINHPLELSTAQRVEILKKPWKLFGFAWNLLGLWRSLSKESKAWMSAHGRPSAVLVGYMGHFDVLLAKHIFKNVPIILDHLIFAGDTAKDRGAQGLKVKLLAKLDRMAIRAATLVLLDTDEHLRLMPDAEQHKGMVVPVGAPREWFDAGNTRPSSEQRLGDVVFYGLYTPLQGAPVIAEAIVKLAERNIRPKFTLIGKGQDYDQVRSIINDLDNVTFIEWAEPEELPRMVASHTIALGIFSSTPKGLRVVPNKVYQSMAAGCAVITSDTAPQRRMVADGAVFVEPGNSDALADAIERLLSDVDALAQAQGNAVKVARKFTSSIITNDMTTWIKQISDRKR